MVGSNDRLTHALGAWRLWDLPQPLQQAPHCGHSLARGSAHIVYEILTEPQIGLQLVARIRQRATRCTAESFPVEVEIWRAASAAGYAPRLVYADDISEVVICQYAETLDKPATGLELGTLCQHIYTLPAIDHSLDLRGEIAGHLEVMTPDHRNAWQAVIEECDIESSLSLLEQDERYLCHNDLTTGNLMRSHDRLIAIDWEYAAMASRYFDLAIAGQGLCPVERTRMNRCALGNELDPTLISAGHSVASLITALWQIHYEPAAAPNPETWRSGALAC